MFRHIGRARTKAHNLRVASLLSFIAGYINVAGFFAVHQLTTNVTGHFTFFVDEVFKLKSRAALVFFMYLMSFFSGAFFSNLITEIAFRKNERYLYTFPVLIELLILTILSFTGPDFLLDYPDIIACCLLFSMGLQNSLVTRISNATVRTTHLTGLFTDLGIELSQLFFYRTGDQRHQLLDSIRLRLIIIVFFFAGGIAGGILYSLSGMSSLAVASVILLTGLAYDHVKIRWVLAKRRKRQQAVQTHV